MYNKNYCIITPSEDMNEGATKTFFVGRKEI